jgi:hypothetical protein
LNAHALLTLTAAERLILVNQYAILEALFPADRAHYASKRRMVESAAAIEYSSLLPEPTTPKDCNRPEPTHPRRWTKGSVNRGGALTPW